MVKNIALFYFSGTGNTELIIKRLQETLEDRACVVNVFLVEELVYQETIIKMDAYDIIGIAYPIYGFAEPRIIRQFEKKIAKANKSIPVFILNTAADMAKVNHEANNHLKSKLARKRYEVFYERIVCMGSNFFVAHEDELVKKLYEAAQDKMQNIGDDIVNQTPRNYKTTFVLKGLIKIVHWGEDACMSRLFGRSLKATKACNQCGTCIRNCPSHNIHLKNNKIRFTWNCFLCMRCIYQCPKQAIKSTLFNFVILKKGYNIHKILENKETDQAYVANDPKGYLKHFKSYLEDVSK